MFRKLDFRKIEYKTTALNLLCNIFFLAFRFLIIRVNVSVFIKTKTFIFHTSHLPLYLHIGYLYSCLKDTYVHIHIQGISPEGGHLSS